MVCASSRNPAARRATSPRPDPVIPVAEAWALVMAGLHPIGTEVVSLSAAAGRVLAHPLVARVTQPPHDVSAMDGYALGGDTGWSLVGAAPAGHPYAGTLVPGQAVRVFTGSVVPAGTTRVAAQEDVTLTENQLAVAPGGSRHIRAAGQDFHTGDVLLPAGTLLRPRAIGLAAAGNHPWLTVRRRPRIAILATGDEITQPGEPIPPGGIVSSNAHAIAALVTACGGEPCLLPIAADTVEALADTLGTVAADLLVTCGGASVGDFDLVQRALTACGFARAFWQVAMRPGKPLLFGRLGAMPVLGLPGNPVSSYVCSVLFLQSAIATMLGADAILPIVPRTLTASVGANDHRQDYLRATCGGGSVTPMTRQDSSLLTVLATADCLIIRPPHAPAAPAGSVVDTIDLP